MKKTSKFTSGLVQGSIPNRSELLKQEEKETVSSVAIVEAATKDKKPVASKKPVNTSSEAVELSALPLQGF